MVTEDINGTQKLRREIELLNAQSELLKTRHNEYTSKKSLLRDEITGFRKEILTMNSFMAELEKDIHKKADQCIQINLEAEKVAFERKNAEDVLQNLKHQSKQEKEFLKQEYENMCGELKKQEINQMVIKDKTRIKKSATKHEEPKVRLSYIIFSISYKNIRTSYF